MSAVQGAHRTGYAILFQSLLSPGGFTFPCDREGHVDMDALSDEARNHYFFARAMVGHDYAPPCIAAQAA